MIHFSICAVKGFSTETFVAKELMAVSDLSHECAFGMGGIFSEA